MTRRATIAIAAVGAAYFLAACGAGCRKDAPSQAGPAGLPVVKTQLGVEMVAVLAGEFEMGSADGPANERPTHRVHVEAFLMDRTEVTQEQFQKLRVPDPSHFKGPQRPVERVTWIEAVKFCNERSTAEGLAPCYRFDEAAGRWLCDFDADGYRLPTEAEWEYACRAGTSGLRSFDAGEQDLSRYAWFADNAAKSTHPVAQKAANPWGLFDLYGNVAEWCNDLYDGGYYAVSPPREPRGPADSPAGQVVVRGGAWSSKADACRSAWRAGENPRVADACFAQDSLGFRCARKLSGGGPASTSQPSSASQPEARTATSAAAATTRPVHPRRVGLLYGDIYLDHQVTPGHPEVPGRLTAIIEELKRQKLYDRLSLITPRAAEIEWLTEVHDAAHIKRVQEACRRGDAQLDTPDVPISARSYDAAVAAAGGVMAAVDAVMAGKVDSAFCAVRPPGHHALRDRAMGFCIFNNIAVAARYIQRHHKLERVLIVDWDVHHGNGTQAAFYEDSTVFYFSAHRSPFYPGSGSASEAGKGKGIGFTLNVEMPAGAGDDEYLKAFREKLVPAAEAFKPDFVLLSAGFDAREGDPLGQMKLTDKGYAELTRIVRGIADRHAQGRLVTVLEGGYNLDGLASAVTAHLRALME